ncbi:MAG TPA: hypothetical protein DCS93_40605 [Microscillaceae bacterium]|nr:hypothetical protein [Microscillaceae bacterium]
MPRNTINTIGAVIFMFGIVVGNGWIKISQIQPGQVVWILTIGFALSFIARTGNLKYIAALVFAFGLALTQGWLKDIPQLQNLVSAQYYIWVMVGGYMVLSFSR